ncbi:MarR family transcriptional regulator [soil metagenome]
MSKWSFLTNHAAVLLAVAEDRERRVRDIADRVGITERATHRILTDLIETGYLSRTRTGKRNSYMLHPEQPLRREQTRGHSVGEILEALADHDSARSGRHARPPSTMSPAGAARRA